MSDPVTRLNTALEGRYRIERELGEGGMATVYLADDLKHERRVALKVLKPELAAVVGAERFLAEIKTTANLQHPHILPLFDSGEADGFLFYVMPYVEGESLRDRLDRDKQLPVDEAVRIATAVANALQAAHDKGVIHRDIKPANILLSGGEPLVADFGIALAVNAAGGGRLTETGLSLGTPHYMSPEQAAGDQNVGPATDVYALGCLVYEMLVGDPPYTGSTAQAVLAKILTGAPARPTEFRQTIPPHVEWAVLRSLEKLPADRFASAAKFTEALKDASARPPAVAKGAPGNRGRRVTAERIAWSIMVVAVFVGAVVMSGRGEPVVASSGATRLNLVFPDSAPLTFIGAAPLGYGRPSFALSDDGAQIVYTGVQDGAVRLFLRSMDSFETRVIPGTEGAFGPFFSPNGRWVGFFVGNQLMKVRTDGGEPLLLSEAANALGADWSDGHIVYVADEGERLLRVPEEGGRVEDLSVAGRYYQWPRSLPGSDAILISPGGFTGPWILEPSSSELIDLPIPGSDARYLASGHLIFLRGSDLHAVRFDLEERKVVGPSVPVLSGVRTEIYDLGQWDVASDGTLVYVAGRDVARGPFTWVDADGSRTGLELPTRTKGTFEISPSGTRLAVAEEATGQNHIWIYDLERGTPRQLTLSGDNGGPLAWNSDGSELLYHEGADLFVPRVWPVEGGGQPGRLSQDTAVIQAFSWSAGGLFAVRDRTHLTLLDVETREQTDIPSTDQTSWGTVVSPAGDVLAYTSGHTGEYHNYVQPLPPTGLVRQVSLVGGAEEPRWSRDGRLLYYRSGQRIMVAAVTTQPELSVGTPTVFFEGDFVNVGGRSYDISVDGTQALIIDGGARTTTTLRVVQGWLEEVERLIAEAEASEAGR